MTPQMDACPTPAFLEPSATASQMGPGPAAHAQWASWATAPIVRTWTRWVTSPPGSQGACGDQEQWLTCAHSLQCAVVTDICFSTNKVSRCVNTHPGFHCLPCPPRYKGSQPFGVGLEVARTEKQVSRTDLPCILGKALRRIR
jgi:hypothetical protein